MCITSGIILNPHNIHRIILGCLILAIKYNEDVYYNNEYYAKIGGVPLDEINTLEYKSFELIEQNLFISDDIYNELNSLLEKSHKIDCLNEEKYLEKIMSGKIIPMNK